MGEGGGGTGPLCSPPGSATGVHVAQQDSEDRVLN